MSKRQPNNYLVDGFIAKRPFATDEGTLEQGIEDYIATQNFINEERVKKGLKKRDFDKK